MDLGRVRPDIQADETLDNLGWGELKLIQAKKGNRFSLDAVLLAHFVSGQKAKKLLDIGSGNGVLPLLLSFFMPKAEIYGIEIQPQLAERAQRNIAFNRLASRINIYQGDIRDQEHEVYQNEYDLMVCNPPFFKVGEGVISPNPELAISRHELNLKLEDLLAAAQKLLPPTGKLAVIYRMERLEEMKKQLRLHQLFVLRLQLVQSFSDQPAKLFLLECARQEPVSPQELPALVIYRTPGVYTEDIMRMIIA